jgi:hypothetical protein
MYKAAFPWSSHEEEQIERKYHKSLASGKGEEVAGNVWVSPSEGTFLNLSFVWLRDEWRFALNQSNCPQFWSRNSFLTSTHPSPPHPCIPSKLSKQKNKNIS